MTTASPIGLDSTMRTQNSDSAVKTPASDNALLALAKRSDERPGDLAFIYGALAFLAAVQIFLVFAKGFNWDEFLHFGQIYDLRDGRLNQSLQTLHARLFSWVPDVDVALIPQMQIVRLMMLACEFATIAALVTIARHFLDRGAALMTGLIYAASSAVVAHGFAIRADPMITALLMSSLAIIVTRPMTVAMLALAGALVGFAGAASIKSVLFLPCFIGAALYRIYERDTFDRALVLRLATVPAAAMCVFLLALAWHETGIPVSVQTGTHASSSATRFLGSGFFENFGYTVQAFIGAPVLAACLFVLWAGLQGRVSKEKGLFIAFALPLLSLIFYRNTFPYFFVFLFASAAVAAIPAIPIILNRFGVKVVTGAAMFGTLATLVAQPYWLLDVQRAQIAEIHRLFPRPTPYLAHTNAVPDYPRIFRLLFSEIGLRTYNSRGVAEIADRIENGQVAFVVADSVALIDALEGRKGDAPLLPADFEAVHGNFIHYAGDLWLSGKEICPAADAQQIKIVRPGKYSVGNGLLSVDGRRLEAGTTIDLDAGTIEVRNDGQDCVALWNLPQVPQPPDGYPDRPSRAGY